MAADEPDQRIYTVSLLKRSNGGLGFLIRQRDEMPYFSVWEIIKNGSAELNGKIKRGDIILRVNNFDLTNVSYDAGLEVLKSIKAGSIVELTLLQNELEWPKNETISALMSPLQKFRKKFISCTKNTTNLNEQTSKQDIKSPIKSTNNNNNNNNNNNYTNGEELREVFKIKNNHNNYFTNSPEVYRKQNGIKPSNNIEIPINLSIQKEESKLTDNNSNNSNESIQSLVLDNKKKETNCLHKIAAGNLCKLSRENSLLNNNSNNMNTIQIIQEGDDIRINIDGNIEILTNRISDRKIISLSPQCTRKFLPSSPQTPNKQILNKSNSFDIDEPKTNKIEETQTPTILKKDIEIQTSQIEEKIEVKREDTFEGSKSSVGTNEEKKLEKTSESTSSNGFNSQSDTTCAKINKKKKGVKLRYLLEETTTLDVLHHKSFTKIGCNTDRCIGSLLQSPFRTLPSYSRSKEQKLEEAVDFINQFYASVKREGSKTHKERLEEVINSIKNTGTFELKETELCFGARTAWRNAPRCIGRIQWSRLQVFDARYVTTSRGMFEAICNHLKYATNKGNIRSAITIFRQRTEEGHDFRVWNSQFVSYAGYKIDDKTVLGDRSQIEFTEICIKLGWTPKYTEFDVLPLVLQANGQDPEWFEIPSDLILDVHLVHPKFQWFKDLNLKWYCVPGVSSMCLDVGGIEFTACPFNGWYMGTEIGRDFADTNRYNKLPLIAEKMGLDTSSNSSLWRDKALIELNHAILYTFQKSNVTITDHHSASESFMKHYENENVLRGGCPSDWVWVVPPLSSHLSPLFHLEMLNYVLKPSYEYQDFAWKTHVWKQKNTTNEEKANRPKKRVYFSDIARAVKFSAKLMGKALAKRVKCTILYATETGKSERFSKSLAEIFKHAFDAKTLCMRDYDVVDLEHETLLLIVTSTFGNGDPPENGEEFKKILTEMKKERGLVNNNPYGTSETNVKQGVYDDSRELSNVRFSVFGLGNSSYPKFCSYAKFLDSSLDEMGAERIFELGLGDELCGQEESFRKWSVGAYKSAVETFCIDTDNSFLELLSKDDSSWSPQTTRLTLVESNQSGEDICEFLSKSHMRSIYPCKLVNKKNLQHPNSGRVTMCVEISTLGYSAQLEYKPGDHVGILASNRKELVDAVLSKVTNAPPPDQLVKVEVLREKSSVFGTSKQWTVDDRFLPFTLRTAFTNYLDITSPLTQNMLMLMSTQAACETDRIQLEKLATDHVEYEKWKLNGYPNLAEVLEEFPSVRPNASLLIIKLPKLQPRFYSISSSPKHTDDINITVGVVEYTPKGKSTHYGVCSKWLEDISTNETIPMFVRGAPSFRLPEDKTCPIIMAGAGTGIAPFRSFWQERKIDMEMYSSPSGINGKGWSKMVLYFGCRQKNIDDLYKTEIEQMVREKVISAYYPAYSRELGQKKVYIQDLMSVNSEDIYDCIVNKQGHFFVCGDVRMAADVTKTLEIIIQKHSVVKMSLDEAKNYVNWMKENLRFHEDIFGNNLTNSTNSDQK